MPNNAALVTGYAVACRRDSYATSAVKTPAPRALRQLACCNTLASQSKVAAEHRCGSLQTSLVPQECIKTTHLRIQTGQARRLRREQPCQTRLEGITASVDAGDQPCQTPPGEEEQIV